MAVIETEPILAENYRLLQQHVYRRSGIVIDHDKHYLFECRLGPIVTRLGLRSINELCTLLRDGLHSGIDHEVAEAMTTNETYFFRDPAQYDAIRHVLLPSLGEQHKDVRRLRFWSAAASTGQEAYSLAITLLEAGFGAWDIEILATDFSSQVLERAKSGVYQQIEVNRGLPAPFLVKYFRRSGVTWQVKDEVRRLVRFKEMDLRQGFQALGPFNMVFCRNVMIYFDPTTRSELLPKIHSSLLPRGWLYFGGAEAYSGFDAWFQRQTVGKSTVYVALRKDPS